MHAHKKEIQVLLSGVKPIMTFRLLACRCSTTELQEGHRILKAIKLGLHMTNILHTART